MSIKDFLDGKPSVPQIMEFVETEARRVFQERKKQQAAGATK